MIKGFISKFFNSKIYYYIVMAIFFVLWLLSFLSVNGKLSEATLGKCEWIAMIFVGGSILALSILSKEIDPITPFVTFTPFVFAHPFYVINMPYSLFLGIGCLIVGLVLHQIIYKVPFYKGRNFIGIAVLGFAMALGGIFNHQEYSFIQFGACLAIGVAITYLYFSLSKNTFDFTKVAHIINALGVFLVLQVITYYYISEDTMDALFTKSLDVGWGISNNVALMLLLTMPFTMYLAITNKHIKQFAFYFIFTLEFLAILFSYSRGAIASIALGLLAMVPACFFITKHKISYAVSVVVLVALMIVAFRVLSVRYHEYYERFLDYVSRINMGSYNGRRPIYDEILVAFKEHPIFGSGMFSPFYNILEEGVGEYQWGHSTLLHTVLTMGLSGVAALLYHFYEKYFYLVKKINKEKFLVLVAFITSGLYGMIDVSYYFINYMIVLIVILATIENLINPKEVPSEVL